MEKAAPDARVTGYASIIPKLSLPDAQDRHVLAAAIHGKAQVLVTLNLKDFPARLLEPFGIEAQTPDAFVARLFDQSPTDVLEAAETHRLSLKNPPKTVPEYLQTLKAQGLTRTANLLTRNSSSASDTK